MQGGNYSDVPWCHKIFTCRKMCLTESIVSADVPKKWSKLHQFGNLLGAGIPLKCSRHSDSCFTISSHISNRSYCSCLTVTNAPMNRFKWLMCRPPPPISQSLFLYKQKIIFRYTRPKGWLVLNKRAFIALSVNRRASYPTHNTPSEFTLLEEGYTNFTAGLCPQVCC